MPERDPIPPLVDPPELKIGCEHEWTRWLERHDGPGLTFSLTASLVGEFCERCGQVRIYRPDRKDEAA